MANNPERRDVVVSVEGAELGGFLTVPASAAGVIAFAHGSGSGRYSTRNNFVAGELQKGGFATLLVDLLTAEEEKLDQRTGHLRFDIELLASRLCGATRWLASDAETASLPVGYFGASTGAAAALLAAATERETFAVVSRGGRPDLAAQCLPKVKAPTLLIVGGADVPIIPLNQEALEMLTCERDLVVIPGATHLFEEPGALESVASLAVDWFVRHAPKQ
jgi:dienelactone hydrolase